MEMPAIAREVIYYVAKTESSGNPSAVNKNDVGKGVSYGILQFNQKVGELPALFMRMHRHNPKKFEEIFGKVALKLLISSEVRKMDLSTDEFVNSLKDAGRVPEFILAQEEIAYEKFFVPSVEAFLKYSALPPTTKALALVFDTSVQRGPGTSAKILKSISEQGVIGAEALQAFALEADNNKHAGGRRAKILKDKLLRDKDNILSQLLHKEEQTSLRIGSQGPEVSKLQTTLVALDLLDGGEDAIDGKFGPKTKKALEIFQDIHNENMTGEVDDATEPFIRIHELLTPQNLPESVKVLDSELKKLGNGPGVDQFKVLILRTYRAAGARILKSIGEQE